MTDEELLHCCAMAAKSPEGPTFKFGVQIPKNAAHAVHLDRLNNNTLWQEATEKELKSL